MTTYQGIEPISTEDRLPEENEYVLGRYVGDNWGDNDDPERKRYWKVVKFVRGISQEERDELPEGSERKRQYRKGDVWGNNKLPYTWDEFGPGSYTSTGISHWLPLPKLT